MPPTNVIAAVQEVYAGLAGWAGKPDQLWFGPVWPRTASSALQSPPVVRFTHDGTETETTFEGACTERWRFTLEVYADTAQTALDTFDRVRFNSLAPTARSGFWYPDAIAVPAGYTFLHLIPLGAFTAEVLEGQFSPTGNLLHRVRWPFEVQLERAAFA